MEIFISCLWHNDDTLKRTELGLNEEGLRTEDYDLRPMIFFHIDALAPAQDDEGGLTHTFIYTSGTMFRTPFSMKEVHTAIKEGKDLLKESIKDKDRIE